MEDTKTSHLMNIANSLSKLHMMSIANSLPDSLRAEAQEILFDKYLKQESYSYLEKISADSRFSEKIRIKAGEEYIRYSSKENYLEKLFILKRNYL